MLSAGALHAYKLLNQHLMAFRDIHPPGSQGISYCPGLSVEDLPVSLFPLLFKTLAKSLADSLGSFEPPSSQEAVVQTPPRWLSPGPST